MRMHALALIGLLFAASGCQSAPTPTPMPSPTVNQIATDVARAQAVAATLTASAPTPIPTRTQLPTALPTRTQTPYPSLIISEDACIVWQEAEWHQGENVCIKGRIVTVSHYFDDPSQRDVWTAHFSFSTDSYNDLPLVSVSRDITKWQGQCVYVAGRLMPRSSEVGPAMVSVIPENPNFSFYDRPNYLCP